jgi:hypothetical protein
LTGNERSAKRRRRRRRGVSYISLGEIYDVSLAARDNKTPLESARFGFKSNNNNNNNNNSLIVSSIALPHPKVVRYSSHRAGRRERENERDYIYV